MKELKKISLIISGRSPRSLPPKNKDVFEGGDIEKEHWPEIGQFDADSLTYFHCCAAAAYFLHSILFCILFFIGNKL